MKDLGYILKILFIEKKDIVLFNHLRIYSWDHSCYFVCCERIYDF